MCCSSSSLLIIPFHLRRLRRGRWVTAGHGRQRLRDRHLDRWIRLLGRWSFWEMPFFLESFCFPIFFQPLFQPLTFFFLSVVFSFLVKAMKQGRGKSRKPERSIGRHVWFLLGVYKHMPLLRSLINKSFLRWCAHLATRWKHLRT